MLHATADVQPRVRARRGGRLPDAQGVVEQQLVLADQQEERRQPRELGEDG